MCVSHDPDKPSWWGSSEEAPRSVYTSELSVRCNCIDPLTKNWSTFIKQKGFLYSHMQTSTGSRLSNHRPKHRRLQRSVLIYRFVCHPSIAYVCPTIADVTSVLIIPAKPEEEEEEDGSEVCCRMWRSLVVAWVERSHVPIRKKSSCFLALCSSEQWAHRCHGNYNKPEHFMS